MSKKKVVYLKAYMAKNLGDDLFLKIFADRYGDNNKIYLYAGSEYKKILNNKVLTIKNIFTVLFNKILKLLTRKKKDIQSYLYKKSDAIVQIGGSLFMEKLDNNYTKIVNLEYPKNKKYYILGSNFGPYENKAFLDIYTEVFKNAEDVCFRDKYSYNLFKDLPTVRYTSDIVYGLDVSNVKKDIKKRVVISVIDCDVKVGKEYKENYNSKIEETIEYLVEKGYEIVLMSFCKIENDESAILEIYNKLKEKIKSKVNTYFYRGNIEEALNVLGESEIIIGSRFHANILGLILGKTIIPIAYSDKTLNALKDIGFCGKIIDIRKLNEFDPKRLSGADLNYKISVDEQIKRAEEQFKILDRELLDENSYLKLLPSEEDVEYLEDNDNYIENEKISIIVNTFNRLKELKECLNSILMQTYSNFEIIIIDDNSNDGTEEYCRKLLNDERIKYFRNKENKGQAYGKKKYFSKATGKYIIFCDDDDYYIDKNFFKKAVKILNSDASINCVCSNSLIKYELENKYVFESLNFKNMISAHEYLKNFQLKYKKPNSTFPTVFRRETLRKNGILEMNMINDSSIYLKSLISNGKVYLLEDIVGIYRVHSSNVTKNLKVDFILENMNEKKEIYSFLKKYVKEINGDEWFKKQIDFTIYYYLVNSNFTRKDLKKILNWYNENIDNGKIKIILKILKILLKKKMGVKR